MKEYIKYLLIVLLLIVCAFIIWDIFIKKSSTLTEYEKNSTSNQTVIIDNTTPSSDDSFVKPIEVTPSGSSQNSNSDSKVITDKIDNNSSVIISSESKVLNEKGQDILDQLSKELDKSFESLSEKSGIVDETILDETKEVM